MSLAKMMMHIQCEKPDENCTNLVDNTEIYNKWTEYTETIKMNEKVAKV